MNDSQIIPQLGRFLLLMAIQVLVLKQIGLSMGPYFWIFLYPVFILLLPKELNTVPLLLLCFATGLLVDMFYGSPGIHAAASVFSGYTRGFLLKAFEPRSGYSEVTIPSKAHFGWQWFLGYASLFMLLHLFFYFSVDAFTFVYLASIALKTLAAWILSMAFVLFYTFIFNPKN